MENCAAMALWNELLAGGKDSGLSPCGLGARDLLRLEMGYLLSGTDFDGSQTTLETGPEWVVKWDHRFIGREALLKQKDCAVFRKLVGIELREKGIPRHGYPITYYHREVGRVTSGTLSPILNKGIALAYVNLNHTKEGDELEVTIRDSTVKATVVRPPFIRKG
jgi:aminomethyltransferase